MKASHALANEDFHGKCPKTRAAGIQYSFSFSKKSLFRPIKLNDAQLADHVEFVMMQEAMKLRNKLLAMSRLRRLARPCLPELL